MDRDTILSGAMQAFFSAILAGYAGDGKGVKKEKSPDGYKTITFEDGDFRVVDRYCVTPHSNKSAGTTTIFFQDTPVWWMSYGGYYEKSAIAFLKRALAEAYSKRDFQGGRGPRQFSSETMVYTNHVDSLYFSEFRGCEEIVELSTGMVRGYHRYLGMSLI